MDSRGGKRGCGRGRGGRGPRFSKNGSRANSNGKKNDGRFPSGNRSSDNTSTFPGEDQRFVNEANIDEMVHTLYASGLMFTNKEKTFYGNVPTNANRGPTPSSYHDGAAGANRGHKFSNINKQSKKENGQRYVDKRRDGMNYAQSSADSRFADRKNGPRLTENSPAPLDNEQTLTMHKPTGTTDQRFAHYSSVPVTSGNKFVDYRAALMSDPRPPPVNNDPRFAHHNPAGVNNDQVFAHHNPAGVNNGLVVFAHHNPVHVNNDPRFAHHNPAGVNNGQVVFAQHNPVHVNNDPRFAHHNPAGVNNGQIVFAHHNPAGVNNGQVVFAHHNPFHVNEDQGYYHTSPAVTDQRFVIPNPAGVNNGQVFAHHNPVHVNKDQEFADHNPAGVNKDQGFSHHNPAGVNNGQGFSHNRPPMNNNQRFPHHKPPPMNNDQRFFHANPTGVNTATDQRFAHHNPAGAKKDQEFSYHRPIPATDQRFSHHNPVGESSSYKHAGVNTKQRPAGMNKNQRPAGINKNQRSDKPPVWKNGKKRNADTRRTHKNNERKFTDHTSTHENASQRMVRDHKPAVLNNDQILAPMNNPRSDEQIPPLMNDDQGPDYEHSGTYDGQQEIYGHGPSVMNENHIPRLMYDQIREHKPKYEPVVNDEGYGDHKPPLMKDDQGPAYNYSGTNDDQENYEHGPSVTNDDQQEICEERPAVINEDQGSAGHISPLMNGDQRPDYNYGTNDDQQEINEHGPSVMNNDPKELYEHGPSLMKDDQRPAYNHSGTNNVQENYEHGPSVIIDDQQEICEERPAVINEDHGSAGHIPPLMNDDQGPDYKPSVTVDTQQQLSEGPVVMIMNEDQGFARHSTAGTNKKKGFAGHIPPLMNHDKRFEYSPLATDDDQQETIEHGPNKHGFTGLMPPLMNEHQRSEYKCSVVNGYQQLAGYIPVVVITNEDQRFDDDEPAGMNNQGFAGHIPPLMNDDQRYEYTVRNENQHRPAVTVMNYDHRFAGHKSAGMNNGQRFADKPSGKKKESKYTENRSTGHNKPQRYTNTSDNNGQRCTDNASAGQNKAQRCSNKGTTGHNYVQKYTDYRATGAKEKQKKFAGNTYEGLPVRKKEGQRFQTGKKSGQQDWEKGGYTKGQKFHDNRPNNGKYGKKFTNDFKPTAASYGHHYETDYGACGFDKTSVDWAYNQQDGDFEVATINRPFHSEAMCIREDFEHLGLDDCEGAVGGACAAAAYEYRKPRRGPPRQLDLESYDIKDKSIKNRLTSPADQRQSVEMSMPRPTFQRPPNRGKPPPPAQEPMTENHMEMIRLLSRQWNKVEDGIKKSHGEVSEQSWEWYREKEPDRNLDNFQAFDLEKFWGKRTYSNLVGKPNLPS